MYRILLLLVFPCLLFGQEEDSRPGRHELTLTTGFTRGTTDPVYYDCGFGQASCLWQEGIEYTHVSTALSYHYLRPVGRFWLGAGGGLEGMGTGRRERFGLLTGIGEYRIGQRRLKVLGRLEAGINLPIGSNDQPLEGRKIGTIAHPSVGLAFAMGREQRRELVLTTGYRFTRTIYSPQQDRWGWESIERKISYRRLTCSLGFNF